MLVVVSPRALTYNGTLAHWLSRAVNASRTLPMTCGVHMQRLARCGPGRPRNTRPHVRRCRLHPNVSHIFCSVPTMIHRNVNAPLSAAGPIRTWPMSPGSAAIPSFRQYYRANRRSFPRRVCLARRSAAASRMIAVIFEVWPIPINDGSVGPRCGAACAARDDRRFHLRRSLSKPRKPFLPITVYGLPA